MSDLSSRIKLPVPRSALVVRSITVLLLFTTVAIASDQIAASRGNRGPIAAWGCAAGPQFRDDWAVIGKMHSSPNPFLSSERERQLGRVMVKSFERDTRLLTDSAVDEYLNCIAGKIVSYADLGTLVTVKVADDEEVNAYALPGGFIYVNTGLITVADDEASLAGMIAHEIAHIAARHATTLRFRFQGVTSDRAFLEFNRELELEADFLALRYLSEAGYDPAAFVKLLEKIRKTRSAPITPDHPSLYERIHEDQIEVATALLPGSSHRVRSYEFDQMKTRVLWLTACRRPARVSETKSTRCSARRYRGLKQSGRTPGTTSSALAHHPGEMLD